MTGWADAVAGLLLAAQGLTGQVLFAFDDQRIDESSGMADGRHVVYTVNDSGDSARVFVVDKATGRTVGVTTYGDRDPVDVEALAVGPGNTLWVGDIGDNRGERSHVTVHRIPLPGKGERMVEPVSFQLAYRDGPRDAEALLVDPVDGRIYVVSKGLLGGTVYVAPKRLRPDRTNLLRPVAGAAGLVTDGAFLPDGRHVIVRTYTRALVLRTPDFRPVAEFPLPDQRQGEGLAVSGDRVLVSTEGTGSDVRSVPLPPRVLRALEPSTPTPSTSTPSSSPPAAPATPRAADGAGAEARGSRPWERVYAAGLGAAWLVALGAAVVWQVRRRRA